MKKNLTITIGRQFGSGGREVGLKLAEKLGVPFYDKELLSHTAKKSNLGENVVEYYDEKQSIPFVPQSSLFEIYQMPMSDKVFIAQSDAIRDLAAKGSCVIVGRCADYVLRDSENVLNLFIHADMKFRIARKEEVLPGKTPAEVESHIRRVDKKRSKYYSYYTDKAWGDARSYHLCVDTSRFGIDGAVAMILDAIERL